MALEKVDNMGSFGVVSGQSTARSTTGDTRSTSGLGGKQW